MIFNIDDPDKSLEKFIQSIRIIDGEAYVPFDFVKEFAEAFKLAFAAKEEIIKKMQQ